MNILNYQELLSKTFNCNNILSIVDRTIEELKPRNLLQKRIHLTNKGKILCVNETSLSVPGDVYILAFGKAAFNMTSNFLEMCKKRSISIKAGLIIGVRGDFEDDKHLQQQNIMYHFGTHPQMSHTNFQNTQKAIHFLKKLGSDDLLITLISGGGSALFENPLINPDTAIKLNNKLVTSGATIDEINLVRKTVSRVKAGKLLGMCDGQVVSIILSDVPNNDPTVIASGPTVPQQIDEKKVHKILENYKLQDLISKDKVTLLLKKYHNLHPRSNPVNFIIGGSSEVQEIIQAQLPQETSKLMIQSIFMNEPTTDVANKISSKVQELKVQIDNKMHQKRRLFIIGTGETTLKVDSEIAGVGGRNQDLVTLLTIKLKELQFLTAWCICSLGTDGIDGNSSYAGAVMNHHLASNISIDKLKQYREKFNTTNLLKSYKATIMTGRTGTNCADLFLGYFEL